MKEPLTLLGHLKFGTDGSHEKVAQNPAVLASY